MISIGAVKSFPNKKNIENVFIPDEVILNTIGNSINFISEFIPADVKLFKLIENDLVKVIFESKPSIYDSFYKRKHLGFTFLLASNSLFYEVYTKKKGLQGNQGEIFNGMPHFQTLYPVINKDTKVIGFLMIERSLTEQKGLALKHLIHASTIESLIDSILQSSLIESYSLPVIYPSDGLIILDPNGIINYSSYIAINILKQLGLESPIEGLEFYEIFNIGSWKIIDVNMLFFEQELTINDFIVNVKVIPLDNFILIFLRDVTEIRHKDQEIRIKSFIIKEIHHRVKNNLQSIASLLRLQQRRTQNQEVKDILKDSINRINSIAIVHDYLSQKSVDTVDLSELAKNIIFEIPQSVSLPDKKINFSIGVPEKLLFSSTKAISIALVLNELLSNTLKHAFVNVTEGEITLKLSINLGYLDIIVSDNGIGLNKNFSPEKNGNLGWQIIRTLVQEDLKGSWVIDFNHSPGTKILISVPF